MSLASANLRQLPLTANDADTPGITVEMADEDGDKPVFSDDGAVVRIEHGDGSVTVSLNGKPIEEAHNDNGPTGFFDNLCAKIDPSELSRIADELIRGVAEDLASRKEWETSRAQGIKLLGLQLEVPSLAGAADGAPVEGMSKVRHPLLLEAVLRFQANARSELLPTDGPVKVRVDADTTPKMGHNGGPPLDGLSDNDLGDALEQDLNHYLTAVATEYYPDTDRMLLMLGFGGTAFKKVYFCPIRGRPVSETVDANDLIVNSAATDLKNAKRVTHKVEMRPTTVKRLQILGVYRDIDLSTPSEANRDAVEREKDAQQGIDKSSAYPEDRDREIYECYCDLDIIGFEHKFKGKTSGLEIPYRVTIDVTSREILSVVRNYDEDTSDLPEPRMTFVKYTFVPGFGFYDIGLLQILGNATNALTAAWREMLDNGMFANFPGFLIAKGASRQNSSILRVAPGAGVQVDTNNLDIRQAVMPLPYNTAQMAPLQALVKEIEIGGQRIGGVSELQVGEGSADAPVGTTLAMIEQATKVMNSVHKRMHAAQAEEFKLLVQCFREHPDSIVGKKCKSKMAWTEQTFMAALEKCELVPQADPNTASHTERVMKALALKQLQAASPNLYDPKEIDTFIISSVLNFANPEQFFVPEEAMKQPPPELVQAEAKVASEKAKGDAAMMTAQARMIEAQRPEPQQGLAGAGRQQDTPVDIMTAHARLEDAKTARQSLGLKAAEMRTEDQNRDKDREAKLKEQGLDIAKEIYMNANQPIAPAINQAKKAEKDI